LAGLSTSIRPPLELVYHHALKDIGLVVDIVEHISPKDIQQGDLDQKATYRHPEAIGKGDESESDDEVGDQRRGENDKGFGGGEVEEDPKDPGDKCCGCWPKIEEPVDYYGEED